MYVFLWTISLTVFRKPNEFVTYTIADDQLIVTSRQYDLIIYYFRSILVLIIFRSDRIWSILKMQYYSKMSFCLWNYEDVFDTSHSNTLSIENIYESCLYFSHRLVYFAVAFASFEDINAVPF